MKEAFPGELALAQLVAAHPGGSQFLNVDQGNRIGDFGGIAQGDTESERIIHQAYFVCFVTNGLTQRLQVGAGMNEQHGGEFIAAGSGDQTIQR